MRILSKRTVSFLQSTYPYYAVLIAIIAAATYLNYNSETMSGMLHYYVTFGDLIRAGIYESDLYKAAGSFPMWGYGFVYAITANKFLIIAAQELFGLFVIICFDSYLKQKLGGRKPYIYFRIILLLSFPLYFFHAVLWPYSFSSSFLLLGIYLLARYLENPLGGRRLWWLFFSAASIGISLNFRSDYLLCIIVIFLSLVTIEFFRKKYFVRQALCLGGWLLIIVAFLAPWAIYTKKVTNHYLVNSTNAGHVLFIGLGQLPNNKWQIRPYDDDSNMREIIETKLHPAVFSTCTYASDSLLKKEWMNKVKTDPGEYIKKCVYVFFSVFVQPFSEGDGFKQSLSRDDLSEIRENMRKMEFGKLFSFFSEKLSFTLLVSLFTAAWAIFLHLAFWYQLIRNIRYIPGLLLKNKMLLIGLIVIVYQIALLTGGYYHRNYNTNIYLLYVIVLMLLSDNAFIRRKSKIDEKNIASLHAAS